MYITLDTGGAEWRQTGGTGLNDPRTNPSQIIDVLTAGNSTYTGRTVSETSALQIATVFGCARIVSNGVAMLDCSPYRVDGESRTEARDHYLWPLLRENANPHMTAYRFQRLMQVWAMLYGNAYAYVDIDKRGNVRALYPWHPLDVRLAYGTDGNGRTQLFYTLLEAGQVVYRGLPSDYVFHLRGMEIDTTGVGISVVSYARQSLGIALAAEEYGARLFDSGAAISGVLEYPGKLTDEARRNIEESWRRKYSGLQNAHRAAILEQGMVFKPTSLNPEDAQFLQSRKFSIDEICRWFGVPPHMLASLERATFSNIEHQGIEFVYHCLGGWLENWEAEIKHSLLSTSQRKTITVEFNRAELLRGDALSQAQAAAVDLQNGAMTPNDRRKQIGLNPHPDGDTLMANGTMRPLKVLAAALPDPAPQQQQQPAA